MCGYEHGVELLIDHLHCTRTFTPHSFLDAFRAFVPNTNDAGASVAASASAAAASSSAAAASTAKGGKGKEEKEKGKGKGKGNGKAGSKGTKGAKGKKAGGGGGEGGGGAEAVSTSAESSDADVPQLYTNAAAMELVALLLTLACDDRGGLRDAELAQGMAEVRRRLFCVMVERCFSFSHSLSDVNPLNRRTQYST